MTTLTRRFFPAQAATDLTNRLLEPMLVLHKGQAHIALARLAEAPARADRDFRFFEQFHGKVHGAQPVPPFRGIACPDEHARPGLFHIPAETPQAFDQNVAAALVLGGPALHGFFPMT